MVISQQVDFVFSAVNMPKEEIKVIEEEYAKHEIPVVSNNSAHRWTPDVPMILPEINAEHAEVIAAQRKRLGVRDYQPYEAVVTTYQAISGAGKNFETWPEMIGNIVPFISGEEEKSEQEPLRIWGSVSDGKIVPAVEPRITCQCVRVPILYGHTAAVFLNFRKKPTREQLIEKLWEFKGEPHVLRYS